MPVLTVRALDTDTYDGLKAVASANGQSMESMARTMLRDGVRRNRRWAMAKAADLSGGPELADIETPYVRSFDLPREA